MRSGKDKEANVTPKANKVKSEFSSWSFVDRQLLPKMAYMYLLLLFSFADVSPSIPD